MQGGRRGRNGLFDFGDPFAGFGGFGGIGHGSMLSGIFGGRDPFDDPFFTQPFGAPFGSLFQSGMLGSVGGSQPGNLFPPGLFGPVGNSPFDDGPVAGFLEHQPQTNKRKGPIIEEINSDDENDDGEVNEGKKDNARKHSRSAKEPYVEVPDDVHQEGKIQDMQNGSVYHLTTNMQPRRQQQPPARSFTFQSSTVTYGGANGAYYTKSTSRRAGSDGVSFEEFKEADSSTHQATHRISRGLNDKGHTLTRKLNSDGRVDSMQTLHNLNQDELSGFDRTWKENAGRHLSGMGNQLQGQGSSGSHLSAQPNGGGWALPSTQQTPHPRLVDRNMGMRPSSSSQQRRGASNARSGSQGKKRA